MMVTSLLSTACHGTLKDRKVTKETRKMYVEKVALILREEYSHFDCIDNTKLVDHIIISEIISSLSNIVADKHRRNDLLYLLNPRAPSHVVQEIITVLQKDSNDTVAHHVGPWNPSARLC